MPGLGPRPWVFARTHLHWGPTSNSIAQLPSPPGKLLQILHSYVPTSVQLVPSTAGRLSHATLIDVVVPVGGHLAPRGVTIVTAQPMIVTAFLISGTLLCWSHKFSHHSGNFGFDRCSLSEKSFVRPDVLILGSRTGGHWIGPNAFMNLPSPPD